MHERDSTAIYCSNSSESEAVSELLNFMVSSSHIRKQGLVFPAMNSVHTITTLPSIDPKIQPPD